MKTDTAPTPQLLGQRAAKLGAERILEALGEKGHATIVVSTGRSQMDVLHELVHHPEIDWKKVTAFQLSELFGVEYNHPASNCRFLSDRLVNKTDVRKLYAISGTADATSECLRLQNLIRKYVVDVAFIGMGENGEISFNDAHSDFYSRDAFQVKELDQDTRLQKFGEGWFHTFREVPEKAICMTISEIMRAQCLICSVPSARKSKAVLETIEGAVSPETPSTILRRHQDSHLFLDHASACRLGPTAISA